MTKQIWSDILFDIKIYCVYHMKCQNSAEASFQYLNLETQ